MQQRSRLTMPCAAVVFIGACIGFGVNLRAEQEFVDEAANIGQSYYYRLAVTGQWNHPDWLFYPSYDHLPVAKYFVGFALARSGYQPPDSLALWQQWMQRTFTPSEQPEMGRSLTVARASVFIVAVLGCVMIYSLGNQLVGPITGLLAALLLGTSPLYYRHARLVMNDCPTQAFVLAGLVFFCALARQWASPTFPRMRMLATLAAAGLTCGLAPAIKLNGALAGLSIAAVTLISVPFLLRTNMPTNGIEGRRLAFRLTAGAAASGAIAIVTFVTVNPYFYARPKLPTAEELRGNAVVNIAGEARTVEAVREMREISELGFIGRVRFLMQHRAAVLADGPVRFPHLAIPTPTARLRKIVSDGIGRWSALGWLFGGGQAKQDAKVAASFSAGAIIGFGLVSAGVLVALLHGRRQLREGAIPTAWLLVAWPSIEVVTLLGNLAVDFDRYYMGVVTWSSLLVPYAMAQGFRMMLDRMILKPPATETAS